VEFVQRLEQSGVEDQSLILVTPPGSLSEGGSPPRLLERGGEALLDRHQPFNPVRLSEQVPEPLRVRLAEAMKAGV